MIQMGKTMSQRRKIYKNIDSITPKIRETGLIKPRGNTRRGKNSQPPQSPPIFGSSNLGAVYEAINFNARSQTVESLQKVPIDTEIEKGRLSPPLFDDSEPSDLEEAPLLHQEQTKTVVQCAIDVEMTLKTPSPSEEIREIVTQYSDSTTQTESFELPKVKMVDASTNTEPHDASTNTENVYQPMPIMQPEQQVELSESELSGSGDSYYDRSESETDLEDFHSDISSIEEDFNIPKNSGSESEIGCVCASPPRTLVFVNQQFHSPESAKLLTNINK